MKVFVSWSGVTAQMVAKALCYWLPRFVPSTETWMSEENIEPGTRWRDVLGRELDAHNFGILCLTPENLVAPWIMFEAGALAKHGNDARVIPYLFRLKVQDLRDPLNLFNAVEADEVGTWKLVQLLNQRLEPNPLEKDHLETYFTALYPRFAENLNTIPQTQMAETTKTTNEDMLIELLSLSRSQTRNSDELHSGMQQIQDGLSELISQVRDQILGKRRPAGNFIVPKSHSQDGQLTIDIVRANWNEVIRSLQTLNKPSAAYLRDAEPLYFEGGALIIAFLYQLHYERFSQDSQAREQLARVFYEIFGVESDFRFIVSPKRAKLRQPPHDSPVSNSKLHDGMNVDIVEKREDEWLPPSAEWDPVENANNDGNNEPEI